MLKTQAQRGLGMERCHVTWTRLLSMNVTGYQYHHWIWFVMHGHEHGRRVDESAQNPASFHMHARKRSRTIQEWTRVAQRKSLPAHVTWVTLYVTRTNVAVAQRHRGAVQTAIFICRAVACITVPTGCCRSSAEDDHCRAVARDWLREGCRVESDRASRTQESGPPEHNLSSLSGQGVQTS